MTLRQLLEPKFEKGKINLFNKTNVTIPLLQVIDWPDLSERGMWGVGEVNSGLSKNSISAGKKEIRWMSSHKMNLIEAPVELYVTWKGEGVVHMNDNDKLLKYGHLNALNIVPIITHADVYYRTGLFAVYPQFKGKGPVGPYGNWEENKAAFVGDKGFRGFAPCTTQPGFADVIAGWMMGMAEHKGVTDICAWLTEHHLRCNCQACQEVGQYVGEAKVLVDSLRIAQKKYPHLGLRILLTQATYSDNEKILAAVPEDVGVSYYNAGKTYDSSRNSMIYPVLENYIAKGRWLGCYPQLTASWRVVCPWSCPQFIKARMVEYADKKLSNLTGYATPGRQLYDFNIIAAAEWAWNAHGRSEREFAAAWATRKGLKNPDAVAEWTEILGPVSWDLYGSRIPFYFCQGRVEKMLQNEELPILGANIFKYYPNLAYFDENIAAAKKALKIVRKVDSPLLTEETLVIEGYTKILREIYIITNQLATEKPLSNETRDLLVKSMSKLAKATKQTIGALNRWQSFIKETTNKDAGTRFIDTVNFTKKTTVSVGNKLKDLGFDNNITTYLSGEADWAIKDMKKPR
jgi:hypothetical protein